MIKKEITQPNLSPENQKLLLEVQSAGFKLKWFIDENIEGRARSNIRLGEIRFRSPEEILTYSVTHELLHFKISKDGFPRIESNDDADYEYTVMMLNDIFEHLLMVPLLQEMGYSVYQEESMSIIKVLHELVTEQVTIDEYDKETFHIVFYVRAIAMQMPEIELRTLERYMRQKDWFDVSKITALSANFPNPPISITDYENLQRGSLQILNLSHDVEIVYYRPKT